MTPRAQHHLNQARQALAQAGRTEHDHRRGDQHCPVCHPPTDPEPEDWTDR